jgi:type IV pilus assembly protein PilX
MKLTTKIPMQRTPRRQQGIVLIIALTVLVAMSLAGVALMRSVDNTVVVAGNISFKQSALQGGDFGANQALTWVAAQNIISPPVLQNDNPSGGYFSAAPAQEPDWFDAGTWATAVTVNGGLPDLAGNVIRYQIHRMCTLPGLLPGEGDNQCSLYFPPGDKLDSGSKAVGSFQYDSRFQIYYRVTTRIEGPRNNVTIVQTSLLI